jgi:hypothetical protein
MHSFGVWESCEYDLIGKSPRRVDLTQCPLPNTAAGIVVCWTFIWLFSENLHKFHPGW